MARGAGGFFPGVVTKYLARADPMPTKVLEQSCYFNPFSFPAVARAWLRYLDDFNDHTRNTFSGMSMRDRIKITYNCWGCTADQEAWILSVIDNVIQDARANDPASFFSCDELHTEWTYPDKLAESREWDHVVDVTDLFQQDTWPNFKNVSHRDTAVLDALWRSGSS